MVEAVPIKYRRLPPQGTLSLNAHEVANFNLFQNIDEKVYL